MADHEDDEPIVTAMMSFWPTRVRNNAGRRRIDAFGP
jgi:hypothetical protein